MSKMCPLKGCKEKPGMCVHEKMMLGLVMIIILVIIVRALGLF